jgi:hypothetical protein
MIRYRLSHPWASGTWPDPLASARLRLAGGPPTGAVTTEWPSGDTAQRTRQTAGCANAILISESSERAQEVCRWEHSLRRVVLSVLLIHMRSRGPATPAPTRTECRPLVMSVD